MKVWDIKVCIECKEVWSRQIESKDDKGVCHKCGNRSGISLANYIKAVSVEEVCSGE